MTADKKARRKAVAGTGKTDTPAPAPGAADANTPPPASDATPLIVAIGASAGGLEAYKRFFSQMPIDSGMAFVLVQHLAPEHHSLLAELVGRSTRMDVLQAADGEQVQAGQVYVIPPDATLTIVDGILQLSRPAPPRQHRWPVDTFFQSLAVDQGENAVCVVLAGSGSDGARGLRQVKEHGGLTVAQAGYDHVAMSGMPASAAATGQVDHVLEVEEMPALLLAHYAHLRATRGRKDADGTRQDLTAHLLTITGLLRAELGHDFSQYKEKTLVRRIQRRMQVLQLDTVPAYIARLREDSSELEALFRELLIGVTEFFRDPAAFAALQAQAPTLLAGKGAADTLRVWVPGCATGEEAYSIAIALREAMPARGAPKVQIFASDIDDRAIAFARAGRYRKPLAGLSEAQQARWFSEEGEDLCVAKVIREMCVFSVHSAIKDPPFSQLDLVSCRNLLIYMNPELQQRLVRIFHYALRPGGLLLLGSSETLARNASLFTVVDKKQRLYARRKDSAAAPAVLPSRREATAVLPARAGAVRQHGGDDALERGARRVLEGFAPAYVVIDASHEILRFGGDAGQYLGPSTGAASLNVFSLLHKGLRGAARAVVRQALSQQRTVVQDGLSVTVDGAAGDHRRQPLRLIAAPLTDTEGGKDLCVLAFAALDGTVAAATPTAAGEDGRVAALEQELETTRQQLQAAIDQQETANEELLSANEEYQSVNEELQSSNEELETSKEEMQSINEELQTINAEMQSKNEMLGRLNSDLQNLMESTQIAILFLDADLRITGFTSGMGEVFHLRTSDRGRPITEIAARVSYPELQADVRQVLRALAPVERVLPGTPGQPTFLLRIRPYRTVENVIEGTVLTFIDITERERQEAERARLAAIVEWSKDAIIGYAPDATITHWNAGAERVLGWPAAQMRGQSLATLLPPDAPEQAQQELLAACADPEGVPKFETRWRRQDGSLLAIDLTCSPVLGAAGQVLSGSAIARDVSERRRAERALQQSERRLAAIIEQAAMGLAQTDLDGRFELVNPRFCQIVGRSAEALHQLRMSDIGHPDDRADNDRAVASVLGGRAHQHLEGRFLRPDGSVVWVNNSITAMLDGNGRPQHLLAAVLDVTAQKRAAEHVQLMLGELNHRVKNTLATVQAIALQTLATAPDLATFRDTFGARLQALSKTHNLLAADTWTGVHLRDLVGSELEPYGREGKTARIEGDDLLLTPKIALALSMALHELATNAGKYGALATPAGQVTVQWHVREEQDQRWLHLQWSESGGAAVTAPTHRGFGTRLITDGLAFELDAQVKIDYAAGGVVCIVELPLPEIDA